jgi:hypothetical protein
MDEMPEVGLFLNNLNNYDSSVELLVNQMQSNFELKKAMKTVSTIVLLSLRNASFTKMCPFLSKENGQLIWRGQKQSYVVGVGKNKVY